MPTYQYACTACDHRFEQVQSFTDQALTACPECQGKLRKLFSSVGVVFKGSGFYRTDSRSSGGGTTAKSSSSSSDGATKSGDSGSSSDSSSSSSSSSSDSGKSTKSTASSGSSKATSTS